MTDARSPYDSIDSSVLKDKLLAVMSELDVQMAGYEARLEARKAWHNQYLESIGDQIYAGLMRTALSEGEHTLEMLISELKTVKATLWKVMN